MKKLQNEYGAVYLRGRVSRIFEKGGKLIVRGADTLSGAQIEIKADLVVLAVGLIAQDDAAKLAQMLHIPYDQNNLFTEAHPKLAPVETITSGVFLTGACQSPKDIPQSVAQAPAAAARALATITAGEIEIEATTAVVVEELCSGCKTCSDLCPYHAISFDEEKKARRINETLCKGCGVCVAACPSGAITGRHFTADQLMAEIEGVLV